ncbi:MAG TPA: altronate dehydratase family protein [Candidatus Acidoferrales bacterium]|nr:altronate dehydratase family protein [Candidatus Acidoferrales bacterium]
MLVDIAKLPTAENSAIHLHPTDNVAVARVPIAAGTELSVDGIPVTARDPIPAGHKIALWDIAEGEVVERYGQAIGRASMPVGAGHHVHTHNLAFEELRLNYEFPETETTVPAAREDAPGFEGYLREDGRVGTRNYIAVVAASNCAAHTAELIARSYEGERLPANVDGVAAFPHGDGCGHAFGPDVDQLRRTLGGVLMHPNVSAAVILGLGCEVNQIDHYLGAGGPRTARLAGLTLQSSGGTSGAMEAARREIARFIEQAAAERRTWQPASKIVLGLNCGGSDSFSGITANPALGYCSDLLAEMGGTPVLAETPEIFGAEHLLVKRARSREVAEKLLGCIAKYKEYLARFQGSFDDNPSPGNKEGGLSNILEKSLGAVAKGGTSPLIDVYDYAERIASPGFCFMNTPGYDPVSLTGLAAGGCNLIAFTTGRGSAIGFPTIPVIKIATNSNTYSRMTANMDVNAGTIADGESTVQRVGQGIFDLALAVAAGRRTCAEKLGHKEFVPWRIGPVM